MGQTGVKWPSTRPGNVYISDHDNDRIRMVDGDGDIDTVAGDGESAFTGDGGPGTEASLDDPQGLAVDPAGNLYIADAGNRRIRRVTVSTGSGSGAPPPGGVVSTSPPGTQASPANPVVTTVQSPTGGPVTIDEYPIATSDVPAGYVALGQQIRIEALDASEEDPLRLTFRFDASALNGIDPASVTILREHLVVEPCLAPASTVADPDPCLLRGADGDGRLLPDRPHQRSEHLRRRRPGARRRRLPLLRRQPRLKLPRIDGPGTIEVNDEDVVLFDADTGRYGMVFDGSDVGLRSATIDALAVDGADLPHPVLRQHRAAARRGLRPRHRPRPFPRPARRGHCRDLQPLLRRLRHRPEHAFIEDVDAVEFANGTLYLSTAGRFSARRGALAAQGGDEEELVLVCGGVTTGANSGCTTMSKYDRPSAFFTRNELDAYSLFDGDAFYAGTGRNYRSGEVLLSAGTQVPGGPGEPVFFPTGSVPKLKADITAIDMGVGLIEAP